MFSKWRPKNHRKNLYALIQQIFNLLSCNVNVKALESYLYLDKKSGFKEEDFYSKLADDFLKIIFQEIDTIAQSQEWQDGFTLNKFFQKLENLSNTAEITFLKKAVSEQYYYNLGKSQEFLLKKELIVVIYGSDVDIESLKIYSFLQEKNFNDYDFYEILAKEFLAKNNKSDAKAVATTLQSLESNHPKISAEISSLKAAVAREIPLVLNSLPEEAKAKFTKMNECQVFVTNVFENILDQKGIKNLASYKALVDIKHLNWHNFYEVLAQDLLNAIYNLENDGGNIPVAKVKGHFESLEKKCPERTAEISMLKAAVADQFRDYRESMSESEQLRLTRHKKYILVTTVFKDLSSDKKSYKMLAQPNLGPYSREFYKELCQDYISQDDIKKAPSTLSSKVDKLFACLEKQCPEIISEITAFKTTMMEQDRSYCKHVNRERNTRMRK